MVPDPGFAPKTPVCPACGVIAPVHADRCASCEAPLQRPRTFAPESGAIVWAAMRASFTCRSCGFPSPLDGVVARDGVDCAQCGSFQRFDPSAWSAALALAHAAADLGGPSPEGRFPSADVWIGDKNPHAQLGMTETFASQEESGLRVEACPGFPACRKCGVLLAAYFEGPHMVTRCATCGASSRYALGHPAAAFAQALRAVVSEEQRVDRRDAQVHAADTGLVSLTCPQCGAALKASGEPTIECAYCRTLAFVPPRARPRGPQRIVKPIVFWGAFEGPSQLRASLEAPAPPDPIAKIGAKAKGFFARGLSPLPGIDLAPRKPGVDVKQWILTASLTALALSVGYAVFAITSEVIP